MGNEMKEIVYHFLQQHPLTTLCTVSSEHHPRASSVYLFTDKDFTFYFLTKAKTVKYHHISDNPHIALAITDEQSYQTVQVEGIASEVTDQTERQQTLQQLADVAVQHHEWQPPVMQLDAEHYVVMKIKPTWLRWGDFRQRKPDTGMFQQIIP